MGVSVARAKVGFAILAVAVSLSLTGCKSLVYKIAGKETVTFAKSQMVPYLLTMDDAQMACLSGEATAPLLMTFERVGTNINQLAIMTSMVAGTCAEQQATEHELRYLRASKAGQADEAMDARVAQKRFNALAAQRYYAGYRRLVEYYGEPGNDCPSLRGEFDQLAYLMGLVTGVQAVVQDVAAERTVDVPMDIAAKADRAVNCVDNNRWWGLPQATRAAVALLNPTVDTKGKDPWLEMEKAAALGEKAGVRLPHVFHAMVAQSKGDDVRLRKAIKAFVAAGQKGAVNLEYQLLDKVAIQMMQNISDRYWTEHTGKRTPHNQLGSFWDEKATPVEGVGLDDIL